MLNIGPGCNHPSVWRHELGHVLGLPHEQARSDRDDYVTIHRDNITEGKAYAFDKYEARGVAGVDRGPYDIASIMQYDSTSFSKSDALAITQIGAGKITKMRCVVRSVGRLLPRSRNAMRRNSRRHRRARLVRRAL